MKHIFFQKSIIDDPSCSDALRAEAVIHLSAMNMWYIYINVGAQRV